MDSLNDFKNYLKIHVDASKSQDVYFLQMNLFFRKFEEFNQENVNAFLGERIETVSKSTFNIGLASIRHYSNYSKIPIELPKYKSEGKNIRNYLTEEELYNDVLKYFPQLFENYQFNIFIVKLLFYTGMRPAELCNLKTEDVNLEKGFLLVRNPKDKDDKKVPFPKELKSDIDYYLQKENEKAFNINYIQLKYIFTVINENLNYKKITPHSMRHSYGHHCLECGITVEKLQLLMGHSDLKTTMIYAQPKEEDAINSYNQNIKIKKKYL